MGKVKGCYASPLSNCSGKLSLEHTISRSLLSDNINFIGEVFAEETINRTVPKNVFGSKCLCEYHNRLLSTADQEALHFMKCIFSDNKLNKEIKAGKTDPISPNYHKIDGYNFEKWCLKTLVNHTFQYPTKHRAHIDFSIILPILFEGKSWGFPYGLSLMDRIAAGSFNESGALHIDPQLDNGILMGGVLNFQGYKFLIWLPTPNSHLITKYPLNYDGRSYEMNVTIKYHAQLNESYIKFNDEVLLISTTEFSYN